MLPRPHPLPESMRNNAWLPTVVPVVDGAMGDKVGAVWHGSVSASPERRTAF